MIREIRQRVYVQRNFGQGYRVADVVLEIDDEALLLVLARKALWSKGKRAQALRGLVAMKAVEPPSDAIWPWRICHSRCLRSRARDGGALGDGPAPAPAPASAPSSSVVGKSLNQSKRGWPVMSRKQSRACRRR